MIPGDTLHTLATSVLDAIVTALGVYDRPAPRTLYVSSGTTELVAWDDCCPADAPTLEQPLPPEGQMVATLARLFRTNAFPAEDLTVRGNCDNLRLAATIDVELIRCAPVVHEDDDTAPPSPDDLDAHALVLMTDALAMARGISCQIDAWDDQNRAAVFGGLTPIGPAGTCVGWQATVLVEAVVACLCQPVP